MKKQDYTATFSVKANAKDVFKTINNVKKWWSEDLKGHSEKLNDVFTVSFGETWITLQIVEFIQNEKTIWLVTDCHKHWLKDKKEWKGTKIIWELSKEKKETTIHFSHLGLLPGMECYKGCERAWDSYLKESMVQLINKGIGSPELK